MNAPFHVTRVEAALGRATARIEELEEEVRRLREILRFDQPTVPAEWGLTQKEADLLLAIAAVSPSPLSTAGAMRRVWSGTSTTPRVVSVHMRRMRVKLKPFGILIRTLGRSGYHLDAGSVHILREFRSGVDTNRQS